MRCKICNKKMAHQLLENGSYTLKPRCKCGKIRARERLKGCPNCESHGVAVQIKKKWYGWLLYCICGAKWRVRK